LLKREPLEGNVSLKVGKHTVELTHLEKLYWPQEQITKGALLRYYLQVGTTIMPYLKGRPAVLKRYPNGINDTGFFQHDVTSGPAYLQTEALTNEQGRRLHYAVYTDLASLLYLVNLGTIDQHVWLARVGSLDEPDYVVFDLDPKGAPFRNVLTVARLMHGMLGDLEMTGCVKTSGSSGIHIFIPVKRGYTFEQTRHWAEQMAREVASRVPKVATTERSLAARTKAQVYIDWQQNASGKTIAAPYTIRPKPRATVSAPVTWDEVEVGFRLTDFTIATMSERMQEVGDVWAGPRWRRQTLPDLA
jgi:bifunctional non-homologous end joining protein LigD